MPMFDNVIQRIQNYAPRHLVLPPHAREAAVLMPLTRADNPEVILTLRSANLSTHGGEVAFPGGRRDPEDFDLVSTALRETQEEVGLEPNLVQVVGPLSDVMSRHGIKVTPYVGFIPEGVEYQANAGEIESIFSVPLEFFANDPRHNTHRIDYLGQTWYVPSYHFAGYKIWGLTAVMLVELVNLAYDTQIDLSEPPQLSQQEI